MKEILKIENLSYTYSDGNKPVLKDLNYDFSKGKIYAIKGRSGSGKTTLLSIISGLERYKEGHIYFNDKELNKINLDYYRSHDIGIVFQSFNLLPQLNALENVILSMDISHIEEKDKKKKALELLESVGIDEEKAYRRILKLSGGEQQRVAIARSLSYNPSVILADEPTGNLDKETENDIMEILINLAKKQDKCVIIVTHSENVSSKVDEVYTLKKV